MRFFISVRGKEFQILALGLVICLSNVGSSFSQREPCDSSNDAHYYLDSKHGHYRFHGPVMSAWPKNPSTGELVERARLDYTMVSIFEVPLAPNGDSSSCQRFNAFSFSSEIPNSLAQLPKKVLTAISNSTSCERERKVISIAPNVTVNAVVIHISSLEDPSMRFNLTFAVPSIDEPLIIQSFEAQSSTAFLPLNFQYMYVKRSFSNEIAFTRPQTNFCADIL